MRILPPSLALVFAGLAHAASPWRPTPSGTAVELRGLAVVSAKVAWASGAKGTVLRTTDGEHWTALRVAGAEALDFRDVHGFDDKVAIAMSAGPGDASRIYKSVDGGAHWTLQIANPDKDGFWDAIAFWDARHGLVFGDPVKGRFQALVTGDGGTTWTPIDGPLALPNEGGFAASGTCLSVSGTSNVWFATGGAATSRVLHSTDRGKTWIAASCPVPAAAPSKGLFSVVFRNERDGFAVGGDYTKAKGESLNGARTDDGGQTWQPAPVLPVGFMSVVVAVPHTEAALVAAGLAGSGYSADGGRTWRALDQTPINTVGFSDATHGWAVGPKGLVLKFVGPAMQ